MLALGSLFAVPMALPDRVAPRRVIWLRHGPRWRRFSSRGKRARRSTAGKPVRLWRGRPVAFAARGGAGRCPCIPAHRPVAGSTTAVVRFAQGRKTVPGRFPMTGKAAIFFSFDVHGLAGLRIAGMMAHSASLRVQGVHMVLMVEHHRCPAQPAEYFNVFKPVNVFLRIKDRCPQDPWNPCGQHEPDSQVQASESHRLQWSHMEIPFDVDHTRFAASGRCRGAPPASGPGQGLGLQLPASQDNLIFRAQVAAGEKEQNHMHQF